MKSYDFQAIEKKWQKYWDDHKTFHAENDYSKPKYYALIEFPYPSGQGLHVGHPRPYTALDIVARNSNSMLADISVALANMRVPTHEFNARELKNGNINVLVTISTQGLEHLSSIIQKISKVPGVLSVERSGK